MAYREIGSGRQSTFLVDKKNDLEVSHLRALGVAEVDEPDLAKQIIIKELGVKLYKLDWMNGIVVNFKFGASTSEWYFKVGDIVITSTEWIKSHGKKKIANDKMMTIMITNKDFHNV